MDKKEKGAALVLVLVVMAVISIIGVTLLSVSFFETKNTAYDINKMQAYYLARSGADSIAKWLVDSDDASIVPSPPPAGDTVATKSGTYTFDGKTFNVNISRYASNPSNVVVEASADVSGVTAKALINVTEYPIFNSNAMYKNAIFSTTTIDLSGNISIIGDIEAGGAINIHGGSSSISGTKAQNSSLRYPPKKWPATSTLPDMGNLNVNLNLHDPPALISADGRYGSINVQNGILEIDCTTGPRIIMVDTLTIKDRLYVVGTGRLDFYINSTADIGGSIVLCDDSGTPVPVDSNGVPIGRDINVHFNIKKDGSITLPGNVNFLGYIYAPDASVDIHGCPGVIGAIIGKIATSVGDASIRYCSPPTDSDNPNENDLERFEKGLWGKQ